MRKDVALDTVHPHKPPDVMLEHEGADEDQSRQPALKAKEVFGVTDGIKHFTASAKTGDNIDEIFDYVVKRISARWKWQDEEDMLNGGLVNGEPGNVRTGGKNDSVKVGDPPNAERKGWKGGCC